MLLYLQELSLALTKLFDTYKTTTSKQKRFTETNLNQLEKKLSTDLKKEK